MDAVLLCERQIYKHRILKLYRFTAIIYVLSDFSICANKLISIYKKLMANIFHLVLHYKL